MNNELKEHYQAGQYSTDSGMKLFYVSRGRGNKVVLLPGLLATSYSFRKVMAILGENYQAISLDWPGTGFSDKPLHPYSHRYLATVLADFLEEIAGDEQVHLVCHGYAGPIAFLMLNQYPEKVKSIVMVSSYLNLKKISFPFPIQLLRIPFLGRWLSYLFFPGLIRLFFNLFLHSSERPMSQSTSEDYYQLLFSGERKLNTADMCRYIDRTVHAQRDMETGIKKMVGLRQIIIGAHDRNEKADQTEYLMQITRLSQVQIVETGRMAMEEAPLSLAKKIEPILASFNRHKNKKTLGLKPWISSQQK